MKVAEEEEGAVLYCTMSHLSSLHYMVTIKLQGVSNSILNILETQKRYSDVGC